MSNPYVFISINMALKPFVCWEMCPQAEMNVQRHHMGRTCWRGFIWCFQSALGSVLQEPFRFSFFFNFFKFFFFFLFFMFLKHMAFFWNILARERVKEYITNELWGRILPLSLLSLSLTNTHNSFALWDSSFAFSLPLSPKINTQLLFVYLQR